MYINDTKCAIGKFIRQDKEMDRSLWVEGKSETEQRNSGNERHSNMGEDLEKDADKPGTSLFRKKK